MHETEAAERDRAEPAREPPASLLQGPLDVRSVALTAILVLLTGVLLNGARSLVLPIVLALFASFTLSPLVRGLSRLRIPQALGAALVVAGLLGAAALGARALYEPATEWMESTPERLAEIEQRLRELRKPLDQVSEATEAVEKLGADEARADAEVTVRPPSLFDTLASQTGSLLGATVVVVVLLYFLLATGDSFLRKIVEVLPRFRDKRRAVEIVRQIEDDVSRYLLTITAINAGLAVAVTLALQAVGLPSPLLWGVMAGVLNFVPVLGAIAGTAIVGGVALLSFDALSHALLAPLVFGATTALEGLVITPAILGRRLTLSPVVVFVGLFVWSWMWGIPGALIAIPMLVVLKILFERIESLQAVAHLMGR